MWVFLQKGLGNVKASLFGQLVVRLSDGLDHSGGVEVVVEVVCDASVAAFIRQGDLAGTVKGRTHKHGVGWHRGETSNSWLLQVVILLVSLCWGGVRVHDGLVGWSRHDDCLFVVVVG